MSAVGNPLSPFCLLQLTSVMLLSGGTAGCLIAARLANAPSRPSVTLLEAGADSNRAEHQRTYEKFSLAFSRPELDYGYTSTSQKALGGRSVGQLRGKGLGGSSQLNFQVWSLGARAEFDHWATLTGHPSWSFESILGHVRNVGWPCRSSLNRLARLTGCRLRNCTSTKTLQRSLRTLIRRSGTMVRVGMWQTRR